MSNATILSAIDTLVATVVTNLATLATAKTSVTTLQTSLATAQAVVAADLADSTTDSGTLSARLPSEFALVSVLQSQLAAAQLAVKTAQAAVYASSLIAGTQCQSVCRQTRAFQRSADETTLLNFVDNNKLSLGSMSLYEVLNASAADTVIAGHYARFNTGNAAAIPTVYPNITNLSANWSTFETFFAGIDGITLVSTS
jgi:hypothetical protein